MQVAVPETLELARETEATRRLYGMDQVATRPFGELCLVARRLVEHGVPYVTINYNGWDTHKQNFQTMRQKLPLMDKGMATLLQDLAEKGLLDSTIIWWGGEFGRTPKVMWEEPWNGGRGHWGQAFVSVVAGGGFKGGQVVGATDATGSEVRNRPVSPKDLIGSIYDLLGFDLAGKLPHPQGLDVGIMPTAKENPTQAAGTNTAGRLSEIMPA